MLIQDLTPTSSDLFFFNSWFCQYRAESAQEGTLTTVNPCQFSSIDIAQERVKMQTQTCMLVRSLGHSHAPLNFPEQDTSTLPKPLKSQPPLMVYFAGITGMLLFFCV